MNISKVTCALKILSITASALAININLIHMLNIFKNISPVDNFGTSNYAHAGNN